MKPVFLTALRDLLLAQRLVERLRRRQRRGTRAAETAARVDEPDPRRVARLDRVDREGRDDERTLKQVRALAGVRRHTRVLQHLRRHLELVLVRDGVAEVELRLLDRLRAQDALERLHVRRLVRGHRGRERPHLAPDATACL